MKVRVIAILYTLVMIISGLVLWNRIDKKAPYSIDMLDLNTKRDEIEEKLHSGADAGALEKEYGCEIIDRDVHQASAPFPFLSVSSAFSRSSLRTL